MLVSTKLPERIYIEEDTCVIDLNQGRIGMKGTADQLCSRDKYIARFGEVDSEV